MREAAIDIDAIFHETPHHYNWVTDLGSVPQIETQPVLSRSGGISGDT
jgi:hypothetical protein